MEINRGDWIIDKRNNRPIWVTAIGLDGTFFMGWAVKNHNPYWCSSSAVRDEPRQMSDGEIEEYLQSEIDTEGFTSFKTIMQSPDDYMYKHITKYGIENEVTIRTEVERERNSRSLPQSKKRQEKRIKH